LFHLDFYRKCFPCLSSCSMFCLNSFHTCAVRQSPGHVRASRITRPSLLAQPFFQTLNRSLFPAFCPSASHFHTFLHGLFSYFSQFANSFELRREETSIRTF